MALGMSGPQIVRKIILPQAMVRMLPAFGNVLTLAVKDTAIATVIAVPELMRQEKGMSPSSVSPLMMWTIIMPNRATPRATSMPTMRLAVRVDGSNSVGSSQMCGTSARSTPSVAARRGSVVVALRREVELARRAVALVRATELMRKLLQRAGSRCRGRAGRECRPSGCWRAATRPS